MKREALNLLASTSAARLDAPSQWSVDASEFALLLPDICTQGLAPLLYRFLKRSGHLEQLPAEVADQLTAEAVGCAARNMMLAEELRQLLLTLQTRGVACAALRGLALAEQLYGDYTARPMGDLDLLIRKEQLPEVKRLLHSRGYLLADRRKDFSEEFSYTCEFFKDRPVHIIVEPHWTIAYPPFVDMLNMDAVWQRCRPSNFLGVQIQRLSNEDLLLHLCLHLMHRGDSSPALWSYELDRFIRMHHASIAWAQLIGTVKEAGVAHSCFQALTQVVTLFDSPVPSDWLDELRSIEVSRMSIASAVIATATVEGKESLAVAFAVKGLRRKWRYALGLAFPSPAFMRLHYGLTSSWQLWWWYPRRAGQLSLGALKGLMHALSEN